MKLNRPRSDATLMENGMWAYHADCKPSDIGDDFFDGITQDVIDPEKYVSSPLASGLGTHFILFLGDLKRRYKVGTFRVNGVKTSTNENGIKTHRLLWSQVGDWETVDLIGGNGVEKRGPGRPPKEAQAEA